MKVIPFPVAQGATYPALAGLPDFAVEQLERHRVNAHYLVMDGNDALAHGSIWWHEVPTLPAERLGIIGHFGAANAHAAKMLLDALNNELFNQGCTLAVGPMDGNTWRRYRFVTDPGTRPSFFLEPGNPPAYPDYFVVAGFTSLARYTSAIVESLAMQDSRIPRAIERMQRADIQLRPLEMARIDDELRRIYRLSVISFADNYLYTPISEAEFVGQYQAIVPYVQPELTLMAEQGDELLGYLFGIPDLNQAQRGETVDTYIIKTIAVLPGQRRSAGLGSVLLAESQRLAQSYGYQHAIHALMHEANQSRNISAHFGQTMRGYTLFNKRLAPAQ